jgi:hypothetical protein
MNESNLICPICGKSLSLRIARGRKSNKPFIMLKCAADARHYRAFIGDRTYIERVIDQLESKKQSEKTNQP